HVVKILEKHDPVHSRSGVYLRLGPVPGDEASAVQNYVEHMLFLLMEEETMGAILEFVVVEGVMERLFLWSLRRHFTDDMKLEQLRMYQMLLSQARQPLLHHKPVLRPLMMLLSSCAGAGSGGGGGGSVEAELVLLLNQLCGALAKDPSVLELFFHTSEDQGAANFLLFSLLIPFTHQEGSVGQQARDALLLIMQLSTYNPRVAAHITDNTYFCPVLATGLSGLYSSLPAKLQVYSEDWHCLERADWVQVPALVQFLNSLQFCCSVIKVGHPSIRGQLLGYIYNGFLVPVLAPALHKCTLEEVMTTTAYLDLFLRSVSEPALLQTFLSFILLHTHDNVQLLDTLVSRVNTPFQLGTVSLALFRTLIGLFCEDVMLQLILRYLIPCTHLCVRERRSLKDRDAYSSSAVKFLFLTPSWCPLRLGAHYLALSLTCLSSPHLLLLLFFLFSSSSSSPPPPLFCSSDVPMSEGDSVGYSRICRTDLLMNVNYLQYLWDARVGIAASLQACLVWSGPYDGEKPAAREEEDGEEREGGDGGRGSVVELEWDDSYEWDDSALPSSSLPLTPPVHIETPQHIQEMRRSAIMLIQGSYVEESDFQDDVLVYNLIAQKDEVEYKPDRRTTPQTRKPVVSQTTSLVHRHGTHRREKEGVIVEEGVREEEGPDDVTDDITEFRKRVLALAQGGEEEEVDFSVFSTDSPEPKDADLEPENSPELTSNSQDRKHGIPFTGEMFRTVMPVCKLYLSQSPTEFCSSPVNCLVYSSVLCGSTGPFISVLLSRLENLLENPIPVNLLVTGILSQLAKYPQPLLRAFLLNTHTDPPPNVHTLYQVLVSVRVQIERYATDQTEFPATVREAWRYLLARDQALKLRELLQDSHSDNRKSVLPNGTQQITQNVPPCPNIPPQARNRVFATVLYAEFLKELAAIAQEHSIVPDSPIEEINTPDSPIEE
uniref:FHF complex subunit HOOK interacting protein 1A n=1 Tax=Oncorhynchus kisutch TaxID=8019 RepID=A0A8C7IVX2_ONCKI